jgi:acetoin utilization deacetylase AcuC-like enzyme
MLKETLILAHDSQAHHPPFEIFNGDKDPHPEKPQREAAIKTALTAEGYQLQTAQIVVPDEILERVHSKDYLTYLRETSASLKPDQHQYPSMFRLHEGTNLPTNRLALQGYYSMDTYTPLAMKTYEIALQSASLAWTLAQAIVLEQEKFGYAICRPPGHHAENAQMGGYCYLNNAAIAAEYLSSFGKVAVLDVDYHHGNGTQHLFYKRKDVLTLSLHADPHLRYPNVAGFENEVGVENGEGFNQNYILPDATNNEAYQRTIDKALDRIAQFVPNYLVVAFGSDTHAGDSYESFQLTTDYYQKMAKTISSLQLPTLVLQEGGYNVDLIGESVVSFLRGFE